MKWSKAAILLLFINTLVLNRTVFGEITEDQNVNQNSNTGKSEKKSFKNEETDTETPQKIETNSENINIKLTKVS